MSGTSRADSLAWAWAGMMVLVPSPWKPAHMPQMSRVGRAPRRTTGMRPGSPNSSDTPMLAAKACLVEGQRREGLVLGRAEVADVVVEARHGDATLAVTQRGEDAHEGVGRVLDEAAEAARVEVLAGTRDVHLQVRVAAQADRHGRLGCPRRSPCR